MVGTYWDRLKPEMDARGWGLSQLATALGVSFQAAAKVRDGGAFGTKNNARAAEVFGLNPTWLATGKGVQRAPVEQREDRGESAEHAGTMLNNLRPVPVVGTAKMGDEGYYDELSSIPGAGDGHIEIATDDPQSYGLRVKGQSMFPAIRDGWYVIVKPNGTPREGEYVLIKHLNGKKMVKEFLFRRADSIEVMSVNGGERHTYDMADIDGIQAIAAVVPPSQWRPD